MVRATDSYAGPREGAKHESPSDKRRRLRREIQRKAHERQAAWAEGGHPNAVERLSADLNGPEHILRPEGLFAERRDDQRGEVPATNRPPIHREPGKAGPLA